MITKNSHALIILIISILAVTAVSAELIVYPKVFYQEICPPKTAEFRFILKNTDNITETYYFSIEKPFDQFTLLNANPLVLKAGKDKTIIAHITPPSDIYGNLTPVFSVTAAKSKAKVKFPLNLNIPQSCYDYDAVFGDLYSVVRDEAANVSRINLLEHYGGYAICESEEKTIPILIRNKAYVSNTFLVDLKAPKWAGLQYSKFILPKRSEAIINLTINTPAQLNKSLNFTFGITNEIGKLEKKATVPVNVELCYTPSIEDAGEIQVNHSIILTPLTIENKGARDAMYSLSIEAPDWVKIEPAKLRLASNENTTIYLITEPKNDTAEGSYKAAITATVIETNISYSRQIAISLKKPAVMKNYLKKYFDKSWDFVKNYKLYFLMGLGALIIVIALLFIALKISKKITAAPKERKKKIVKWPIYLVLGILALALVIFIISLSYEKVKPAPGEITPAALPKEYSFIIGKISNISKSFAVKNATANITPYQLPVADITPKNITFFKFNETLAVISSAAIKTREFALFYLWYIISGIAVLAILIIILKITQEKPVGETEEKEGHEEAQEESFISKKIEAFKREKRVEIPQEGAILLEEEKPKWPLLAKKWLRQILGAMILAAVVLAFGSLGYFFREQILISLSYLKSYIGYIALGIAALILILLALSIIRKRKMQVARQITEEPEEKREAIKAEKKPKRPKARKRKAKRKKWPVASLIILLIAIIAASIYFNDKLSSMLNRNMTQNITVEGIKEEAPVSEELPRLPTIAWLQNRELELDLSDYFYDPDGDPLTYAYTKPEHIEVDIAGNTATLKPEQDWYGSSSLKLTADDQKGGLINGEIVLIVKKATIISAAQQKIKDVIAGIKNKIRDIFVSLANKTKEFFVGYLNYIILGVSLLIIIVIAARFYKPIADFFEEEDRPEPRKKRKR